MNYGQLSELLIKLGFSRTEGDNFIAFEQRQTSALIALPRIDEEIIVTSRHLIAIKKTIVGKGIVSAIQFQRLIAEVSSGRLAHPLVARPSRIKTSP